jgi:hypothetical protein
VLPKQKKTKKKKTVPWVNKKWQSLTKVSKMSGLHVAWLLLKCCCPTTWKGVHVGRNGIDCNMTWSCSLQQGMIFSAFLWGMCRYWSYNFSKKLLKIKHNLIV